MATYEIRFKDEGCASYSYGENRAQAKYNHYLRVADCFDSFRGFLSRIASVKRVPHRVDAYDFIRRQYGRQFYVGEIVVISGEGSLTGASGEVIHPSYEGAYVSVLVDGCRCLFHPMSLTVAPDE